MTIQSIDQLISAITAGQNTRYDWNKQTAASPYTAGRWYDLSCLPGLPVANSFAGTALTWKTCDESTGNGTDIFGIPNGGNVSTSIKHLLNMSCWSAAATSVPGTLMLIDMQGYWPGIDMNVATSQTLLGSPSLRYSSGAGLRLFLTARATTGATPHNIAYSYTNQAGSTGRVNPVTVSATASAIVGHIVHSGSVASNYGPFLPMASGDSGIQTVASIQLSAGSGSASTAALVLCRPVAQISISVAGLMTEKDLLNQIPSLPRMFDGACLTWIYAAGTSTAASTLFNGALEFVWG